jgi:hypothetical protein
LAVSFAIKQRAEALQGCMVLGVTLKRKVELQIWLRTKESMQNVFERMKKLLVYESGERSAWTNGRQDIGEKVQKPHL